MTQKKSVCFIKPCFFITDETLKVEIVKDLFTYIAKPPRNGQQAKQLVVLIHGYGFDATAMEKMAEEVAALLPDAMIIMPHAPDAFVAPQSDNHALRVPRQLVEDDTAPAKGRQWFSIQGKTMDDYKEPILALAQKLNHFIDAFADDLSLPNDKIAIMGFSQGGAVALFTAMTRREPIGAIVGHSTIFMHDPSLMLNGQSPTLFLYGDKDEEFSQTMYGQVIGAIKAVNKDLEVTLVKGLRHKTSDASRKIAAAFIARHIG